MCRFNIGSGIVSPFRLADTFDTRQPRQYGKRANSRKGQPTLRRHQRTHLPDRGQSTAKTSPPFAITAIEIAITSETAAHRKHPRKPIEYECKLPSCSPILLSKFPGVKQFPEFDNDSVERSESETRVVGLHFLLPCDG